MSLPRYRFAVLLLGLLLALLPAISVAAQDAVADSADFKMDGYVLGPNENATNKIRDNLFLKTIASRQSCFEGEAFEVEYLLYSRLSLDARVGRKTGFEGFASIEMPTSMANGKPMYRWHNGKVYKVYAIRRVQLTPLQSGTLAVGTLSLEATITFLKKNINQSDEDIDPFLPGNRSIHNITIESPAVTIIARPLPASNNSNATWPVGQFKIEMRIDSAPVVAGSMSHLLVSIQGQGQWSKVQCPDIQWPQGFQAYEPSVTEQLDSQHIPVAGQRIYSIPFETPKAGQTSIPGCSFSFFNPGTSSFETVNAAPISMVVAAANSVPNPTTSAANSSDYTFAFTKWAPWFFASAALVLLVVLLRAAVVSKRKSMATTTEHWDKPDAGIGNVSRRLDAGSGQYKSVGAQPATTATQDETEQLAKQYYHSVMELLQERLAKNSHKSDPLYLQLMKHGVAENHSRSIMQFLDRCEALMQHRLPTAEDPEQLSAAFYQVLRLIRNNV